MSHRTTSTIHVNAPAARVWEALTRPELVKQWQYGTDVMTTWHKGSPIVYRNEWEGAVYEQTGPILVIEPPTLVRYTLFAPRPGLDDKPENDFTMTSALEETNGTTTLLIIQDDPREQPPQEAAEENDTSILEGLKKLVEGEGKRESLVGNAEGNGNPTTL
jgi:uncharacterized protein YndB with AHSA1/START domain